MAVTPALRRTLEISHPLDLGATLGFMLRGRSDPTMRLSGTECLRATRTPEGPAALRLRLQGSRLSIEAWGDGAEWAVRAAPALIGEDDPAHAFSPDAGPVADIHRRHPGLRIPRSQAVLEALVPTILEQKVIGLQARASHRALVRILGEPAPGPLGLLLPPAPERLAAMPYWEFHPIGIERRRAEVVRAVAARAGRMEEAVTMSPAGALRRLTAIAGVGPWTAAEVALVALGDADAVPVGDFHLPHLVAWTLAGEERGTDERMLELLAPFEGHRGRVVRLLLLGGMPPPRRGPRLAFTHFEKS